MKHFALFTFITFLIFPNLLKAQEKRDTTQHPLFVNLQFAGNVGIASLGVGTNICNQKVYLGIIYGYLPNNSHDVEVHTIALKAYYRFFIRERFNRLSTFTYFGTNINYGITQNTYLNYPNYFPDDYYNTNAIHFAPFVGYKFEPYLKNQLLGISSLGLYFELGTLDKYIDNLFTSKQVGVFDVINLCLGMSFKFAI